MRACLHVCWLCFLVSEAVVPGLGKGFCRPPSLASFMDQGGVRSLVFACVIFACLRVHVVFPLSRDDMLFGALTSLYC